MLSLALTGGLRAAAAATYNKLVGALVDASAVALGGFAPLGLGLASSGCPAFAATVRVVHRVHGGSAHLRSSAEPSLAPGLAQADVLMVHVADLPNRRKAVDVHHAHLTRR